MTLSEADAAELIHRQQRYQHAREQADALTGPARHAYYQWLLHLEHHGATQKEIADKLGVNRTRAQQLLDQARRALG